MAKQKLKTRKSVSKRFKRTASGKLMRRASGQSHFNAKLTGKQRRARRKLIPVSKTEAKKLRRMMPYR